MPKRNSPRSRAVRVAALLAIATATSATGSRALAQSYPGKPIRVVVGFPAGGPTDVVARLVGQKLSEALGQAVLIDNRPGAGGVLAGEVVAKSAPDGYTLLMGTIGGLTVSQSLQKMPYQTLRDFAPITQVVANTNFMVLHPSVPARTVKEFIALAKSRPGALNYASSGNGTITHLSGELFKSMARVELVHVPYKGGAPALNALLGGEVDLSFENALVVLPHIKSGRLRAIAVTGSKRAKAMPGVPTMSEAGLPGYQATGWYGLLAPAATPREIVQRLYDVLAAILRTQDVIDKFEAQGSEPVGNTPEQFSAYIQSESEKWAKVVKTSGMKVD